MPRRLQIQKHDDLIANVERGFLVRQNELRNILRGGDTQIHGSEPDGEQIDLRSFSNRFLRSSLTLTEYIENLRSLLPTQYKDLLLGYYFSGEYVSSPENLLNIPYYDNA